MKSGKLFNFKFFKQCTKLIFLWKRGRDKNYNVLLLRHRLYKNKEEEEGKDYDEEENIH